MVGHRRNGPDHRRPQHHRMGFGLGGGNSPLPHLENWAAGPWHRRACLHPGHAPRLRRRPHRGDRQHYEETRQRRKAAPQCWLLLLAGALHHRLSFSGLLELRHSSPQSQVSTAPPVCTRPPTSSERQCRAASLADWHSQSDCADWHCQGLQTNEAREIRQRRAGTAIEQPGLHEPVLRRLCRKDRQALEDVSRGGPLRSGIRHGH